MKRACIIAKGTVQRVGYRDFVQDIARSLEIKGYVKNLRDGSVEIVGEGSEDVIEEFIEKIKPEYEPLISVTDISVVYGEPTGEFEYFDIIRGDKDEENAERLDTAARYLKELIIQVSKMNANLGNKIDAGREENKKGFSMLAEKIDAGREENKKGFSMLAEKIDGIKEDTVEIKNSLYVLREIHQETLELRKKYDQLSKDIAEIKRVLSKSGIKI
ncbi:MAG: acylphosphatase [Methanosarcinales archaeon]